jgi:hypothetical protein
MVAYILLDKVVLMRQATVGFTDWQNLYLMKSCVLGEV